MRGIGSYETFLFQLRKNFQPVSKVKLIYPRIEIISEGTEGSPEMELIELRDEWSDDKTKTSKKQFLSHVKSGLEKINDLLNTDYSISQVTYRPFKYWNHRLVDLSMYEWLTIQIVRRYHRKDEFSEKKERTEGSQF